MNRFFFALFSLMLSVFIFSCATSDNAVSEKRFYEYTETAVSIPHGDHIIPAIMTLPNGNVGEHYSGVVMLHGYGSDKNEAGNAYKMFAPELAKNGIASIRIDFMGNGESEADYINFNFDAAVSDASAAADYLSSQTTVDAERIGLIGWSMGGTVALLSAGRNSVYKSIVTWAGTPVASMYSDEQAYEIAKRDGYAVSEFDWRTPLKLGLEAFEIARRTDVLAEFSKSTAPILAINGSIDDVVLPETVHEIIAASSNNNSEFYIIDGADHTFHVFTGDMTVFNELCKTTLAWLQKTL